MQAALVKGSREDSERCLGAMVRYGVKEVPVPPGDLAQIRARTRPPWNSMAGKLYPQSLLDGLPANLERCRAHASAQAPPVNP